MLFNNRVIFSGGGSLIDISRALSELGGDGETIDVIADDFLYIGSDLPFTHRYFKLGDVVNAESCDVVVDIWDGKEWVAAVDVQDGTSVGGITFARSGVISWTTQRNAGWSREATTEDMTGSGLESDFEIYDLYWVRIRFQAAMTTAVELDYVGHCFSDDNMMRMQYPDLMVAAVLEAFGTGKEDWSEQHCLAAEEVVRYLQRKKFLWSPNQLLNWQQFSTAATHKAAEIAYSGFPGDDQEDQRKRAEQKFYTAMNQNVVAIDKNQDGHAQVCERKPTAGWFRR